MNIRPLYDRIEVRRIEEQETAHNGIVIPDSAKKKPQQGEMMAVGLSTPTAATWVLEEPGE